MRAFFAIWLAQTVSFIGSQLASFGLGVWIYQRTGSATLYGLTALAAVAPQLLAFPLAGVVVDRWDRRRALLLANTGAGLCSLLMTTLLLWREDPPAWALLITVAVASSFHALEFPALSALTTQLVPAQRLGRANGLVQLGLALGQILAPWAGSMLLSSSGLLAILILDVASYIAAVMLLLLVRMPAAEQDERPERRRDLARDMAFGFRYVAERWSLVILLLLFFVINFNLGIIQIVTAPLLLEFTDVRALGLVLSTGGAGMLVGSLIMAAWGGPRRRVFGLLFFTLLHGTLLILASMRRSVPLLAGCAFGVLFTAALINACSQTIWQRVTPLALQGRVFAVRAMIARASLPLAYLVSGPLADGTVLARWSERLADSRLSAVIELGAGRGGALLLALLGLLTMASAAASMLRNELRELEQQAAAG